MRLIIAKIAKDILLSQDSHVRSYKENELQKRLTQACKDDDSHTRRLSQ